MLAHFYLGALSYYCVVQLGVIIIHTLHDLMNELQAITLNWPIRECSDSFWTDRGISEFQST